MSSNAAGCVPRPRTGTGVSLALVPAAVALAALAPASALAQEWMPCGGNEGNLWSWAWAGANGENVTTERDNFGPRIAHMVDLSGNGHHYFNNDPFDEDPPTRPGYQVGFSHGSYSTSLPIVAVNRFADGTQIYLQWMDQEGSMAANEFYLAFAGYESRSGGHRELWGTTSEDRVRLEQVEKSLDITIGGREHQLTDDGAWESGPVLIEIWRDGAGNLTAFVNGVDRTDGAPRESAVFDLSGIGGGIVAGNSAWDDYAFEYIACDGLPSAAERFEVREYLRSKWGLFGSTAPPPTAPMPPTDLTVTGGL